MAVKYENSPSVSAEDYEKTITELRASVESNDRPFEDAIDRVLFARTLQEFSEAIDACHPRDAMAICSTLALGPRGFPEGFCRDISEMSPRDGFRVLRSIDRDLAEEYAAQAIRTLMERSVFDSGIRKQLGEERPGIVRRILSAISSARRALKGE